MSSQAAEVQYEPCGCSRLLNPDLDYIQYADLNDAVRDEIAAKLTAALPDWRTRQIRSLQWDAHNLSIERLHNQPQVCGDHVATFVEVHPLGTEDPVALS